MYVYFNERSAENVGGREDLVEIINRYAHLIKDVYNQGFSGVKYEYGLEGVPLRDSLTLKSYCAINCRDQALKVILSTAKKPYFEEGDEQEKEFVTIKKSEVCLPTGEMLDVYGMTAACLYKSICVGFDVYPWDMLKYNLKLVQSGYVSYPIIYCLTKSDDLEDTCVVDWLNDNIEPEIQFCGKIPADKSIKLSQHHGYSELMKLSKKLVKEPFVVGIVNSIDHNESATSFVSNIPDEAYLLDLTLVDTDKGYSLRIKTTARNKREQKYIAKLLTDKYL